ncbi:MAG: hypothetical protein R3358_09315 [Woeseiaceae bacterium]|nr:hypothetical protein [Woeseiaceae bacterium]
MNCFSRLCFAALLAAALAACGAPASESDAGDPLRYDVDYRVTLRPDSATAEVRMRVRQERHLLREIQFDARRVGDLDADGNLVIDGDRATWTLPENGGDLSWSVRLEHRRGGDGFDALLTPAYGIFRAEDLVPRAAARSLRGSRSHTRLRLLTPGAWSAVTEYPEADGSFYVSRPGRRFAQPAGWIAVGDLGVRREQIAGVRVAIAGPTGQAIRRLDMLALLNWNLPELARVIPELPARLTVVSAGDPMWRGALSAPQSIYVHADRPLISENGTSTLLHELMHVALGASSADGFDWIIEGIAEYYSLELMKRSGTLTPERYLDAIEFQRQWARDANRLCARHSSGATTAYAVMRMHALDAEIREATEGESSLDDVLLQLVDSADIDLATLLSAATAVLGHKPDALHSDRLPGCRSIGG